MKTLKRLSLFTRIVWQQWDYDYRLSVRTAWEVARIVYD